MAFILVASGTQIVDNLQGGSPLEFAEVLPQNLQLPFGGWFLTTTMRLQLQIFFSVTIDEEFRRQSVDKLYNPTQLQIGRYALSSDSFVSHGERLLYTKQVYSYETPEIILANNQAVAPIVIRRTTNSQVDHAQNVTEALSCVDLNIVLAGAGASTGIARGSTELVQGGLCLTITKGLEESVQLNQFIAPETSLLPIDLLGMSAPDLIQGVLWTGYQLEIGWQWGYNTAESTAIRVPDSIPITGPAPFRQPGQSCLAGRPIPNSNFCPSGYTLVYDLSGASVLTCTGVPVP
jgi:hypothetical protein